MKHFVTKPWLKIMQTNIFYAKEPWSNNLEALETRQQRRLLENLLKKKQQRRVVIHEWKLTFFQQAEIGASPTAQKTIFHPGLIESQIFIRIKWNEMKWHDRKISLHIFLAKGLFPIPNICGVFHCYLWKFYLLIYKTLKLIKFIIYIIFLLIQIFKNYVFPSRISKLSNPFLHLLFLSSASFFWSCIFQHHMA